jgi:hypothetical protein
MIELLVAGQQGLNKGETVILNYGPMTFDGFLLAYGFILSDDVSKGTLQVKLTDETFVPIGWDNCNPLSGHEDQKLFVMPVKKCCWMVSTTMDKDLHPARLGSLSLALGSRASSYEKAVSCG